jgi:predicted Ser/Thr protein kinase
MQVDDEVGTIHPPVYSSYLQIIETVNPLVKFFRRSEEATTFDEPDFLAFKKGNIPRLPKDYLFPVEVKGKWTLKFIELSDNTTLNQYEISAIEQIYKYMVNSERKYGVLTSYDTWWFTYRSQNGDHYISEPFSKDMRDPSAQECLAFLCSKDIKRCNKPPTTAHMSLRTPKRTLESGADERKAGTDVYNSEGNGESGSTNFSDGGGHSHSTGLQLGALLGTGRCKVFEELTYNMALKAFDASEHADLVQELHHEAAVYLTLTKLQGKYIPRLVWYGVFNGTCEGIGISPIGSVPSSLTEEQKKQLSDGIRAIHKLGVLHGDLKIQNVLLDTHGKAYLIDFGFAVLSAGQELLVQEEEQFAKLLSQY